jgi:hypothetical protein
MAKLEYVINFDGMDDFHTELYDAETIPDEVLFDLQDVQYESLCADLPRSEWSRAAALTKLGDFRSYRRSRVLPQTLVGKEWNDDQLFTKNQIAVVYDGSNQVVGGAITAYNTSASQAVPKELRPAQCWAKMLTPAQLGRLPGIGDKLNKKYVHLREMYSLPGRQTALEHEDNVIEVSGIPLMGLYYALTERQRSQVVIAHTVVGDPADATFIHSTRAIGMQPHGERSNTLPGYDSEAKLVDVRAKVGGVMGHILIADKARYIITNDNLIRVPKPATRSPRK